MINLICVWVSLAVIVKTTTAQSGPLVKTPLGSIQGKLIKSYEGRPVSAFEGIPYAKPPVGNLRFKEPEPIPKWSETLVADKTYKCLQYTLFLSPTSNVEGDEDCLYLYVYVPKEKITGDENMDVVIHIHGGGFTIFDPKSIGGPDYIMDRDIVYVSMNYRLGILGFLSTQDEVLPGNNGLKDQALAMKWVKDNIKYFGGNPDSITLTGASGGGSSVHYHYLSPLSKGLFNRGFSQSGTALNMWALSENPVANANKLGQMFACKESSKDLVDCLQRIDAKSLVLAHGNFIALANTVPVSVFGPVIEWGPDAFLPDHPYKLLLEGRINDYPWITSITKDEGVGIVGLIVLYNKLQEFGNRWNELLPSVLDYNETAYELDKKPIAKAIGTHYLGDEALSNKTILNLIRLFSDRYWEIDAIKALCLHSRVAQSPVYFYYFDYLIDVPVGFKANLSVVGHTDDTRLLFHWADNPVKLSDSDEKMKDVFIDFLYRYASTGIPDFKGINWEPVSPFVNPISYMHILSPNKIQSASGINLEPFLFWHSLPILENENLFPYLLNVLQFLNVF